MTDNTTPKHPRNQVTRRDFLNTMGTALGGVALTMHGGGAASPALGVSQGRLGTGAIPNGYNFYRVFTANTGATLPFNPGGTNPVLDITPAVFMGTDPSLGGIFYIYFHGRQTSQANAAEPDTLFLLNMDYTKTPPGPSFLLTLVAQGQSLGSGLITGVPIGQLPLVVSRIGTGDSNSFGHYATTLSARDTNATVSLKSAPGVYLFDASSGVWHKTARFGDAAPDGSNYGGIFGDVAIDDNDNVTFIAATTQGGSGSLGTKPRKGGPPEVVAPGGVHKLIHLPRHKRHGGQVLLRSGDLIPGTTAIIRSFGFVDVASYGQFVVQIGATPATGNDRRAGTALVRGEVGQPPDTYQLLAASPQLVPPALLGQVALGDTYLGPRIGANGYVAYVNHMTSHHHRLILAEAGAGGYRVLRTIGEASSLLGDSLRRLGALGAPVVAPTSLTGQSGGIIYTTELLSDGSSVLTISDGTVTNVLLKSGDLVQGKQITEILQGYHPRQADTAGRIAFVAEFLKDASGDPTDPNNIETSIVVGIPT